MSLRYLAKLNDEQVYAAQEMTHSIWGEGRTLDSRLEDLRSQMNFMSKRMLSMSGLLDEKGKLVSSLKRYNVPLMWKHKSIPCIGLGAIFTPDSERGKGYAKELILSTIKDAQKSGAEAIILYSDIGPSYYAQLGFKELNGRDMLINTDQFTGKRTVQFRKAKSDDTDALIAFFHKSFEEDCVHGFRDFECWSFFRKRNGPVEDYIAYRGAEDLGYVSFSSNTKKDYLFLEEFYIPQELEKQVFLFLKEEAEKRGVQKIKAWEAYQKLEGLSKTYEQRLKVQPMILSLNKKLNFDAMPKEKFWFGPMESF